MTKMLVAMNYTQDGTRTITSIHFSAGIENYIDEYSQGLANEHDEVYIVDFNPNDTDFINTIVIEGCKL